MKLIGIFKKLFSLKNIILHITVISFIIFLFLPGFQMRFGFIEEKKLDGVVVESRRPTASIISWITGEWQNQFATWFGEHVGFRGHLVKTDNTINFSLFKEISAKSNTKIILGKDNYLYEKLYVDQYLGGKVEDYNILEKKVKQLKLLQDKLTSQKITFLFLISPSKATIYPEFIPEKFGRPVNHTSNYDLVKSLLQKYGVQYLDGRAIVKSYKDELHYGVFPKGGTHWNYYTACRVVEEYLVPEMERLSSQNLVDVNCDPSTIDNKAYGLDGDLARIINIWSSGPFFEPIPHPAITSSTIGDNINTQPDILFIGDSFSWNLFAAMDNNVYESRDFLYYFNDHFQYKDGKQTSKKIDKKDFNLQEYIKNRDFVIIENNEAAFDTIGFGILDYIEQ